jgi:class 3 adenylate cyclase/tetratricopeptide (TPR) repeat protein
MECGAPQASSDRFQVSAAPSRVSDTRQPTPNTYTPQHLAEKILAGRDALAGERKQVTVLFADVVGSTELIRDRDPEDAQRLLDGAVQRMMRAVHSYEGTVSRLQGDGLMALFGAPVAHEDHAVRACYAALAMLEAIRGYADEARRVDGAAIQMRVGLNSGEVIVRLISDDLHMDYTAMGQTVHLAARMEGLANAGTGLLTSDTLALVEGRFEVRPLGPTPVKGLEQPVDVYELVGSGAARTRLQASAARGLTRFVGRQRELEVVQEALGRAASGNGQVVALVGEPGVGKSRLVYEATQAANADGWLVLQCGAISYGTATPYLPAIDLLRSYAQIEAGDDVDTTVERVTSRLMMLDPALASIVTPLLALLDLPVEDAAWASLDPPRRRRAILDALQRLLVRESQNQPLLLVFEDLHWIDSETQALLDELVGALPTVRTLLLVNYRPEFVHGWGNKRSYTQVRIDPLATEGADDLLQSLLGVDESLVPLKRQLNEQTQGNPFFLEECVRSLVETGALIGRRGAYSLTQDLPDIRVPATVQAILAARVDRLEPDDKRVLQTAAVIGKDVPFALLRAIAELPDDSLHAALSRLQAAELLYAVSQFPEREHTFTHALTHEVAYASLLLDRRRELHGQIVTAIERLYPDRLDEHAERLAHHALRGEGWEDAVVYCRRAARKSVTRSANREAVAHFEQALAALEHLPEGRDRLEQAIDLRLDLRQALTPLGEFERTLEHLRQAETTAEALGDQRRLGQVLALLAYAYYARGDIERATETGERAVAIGRALDDVPIQVVATGHLAQSYWQGGEYGRAVDSLKWLVARLQGELVRERYGLAGHPAVGARLHLVGYLAELGEFAEGMAYGEEAVRLAEALDHPYNLAMTQVYLGNLCLRQGRLHTAISHLEQSLALFERWDLPQNAPQTTSMLGCAYALDGRHAEGVPLLEQAAAELHSRGVEAVIRFAIPLIEGHLLAGRLEEALLLAGRALDSARQRNQPGLQGYALRLLSEIAVRRDPPDFDEAEPRYREALALAEELGLRPLQAHCHLGLGKLYRRLGRADEARAELSAAISMLREMGMTFWLPGAEAELAATLPPSSTERLG